MITPPTVLAAVTVPLTDAELPVITPPTVLAAVTVPVVDSEFDPQAANNVLTLALLYPAGNPVNRLPLPIMYEPVTFPLVL